MAYVSVSEWRPEQVTEWLKGLDVCVTPYLHWFSNNEVNGQQLLNLSPDELTHLGVLKIGHQELILDAVEHLRNFHYELDRENLQLLALRVSCAAHSLYNEIKHKAETTSVPTQTMADVANVINHVKPLVSWLDRPPFSGQIEPYAQFKSQLLRISLEMATCAQRDTFAERPISEIRNCSSKLAKLADSIIQDLQDPMLLQPASLDLATIKKRVGEDLGFFLIPSFHGIHQISDMKLSSPAHQSGKIQPGDEVVQVNYQTVVGWSRNKVLALFDESPNDLLLTLKRRPRHVKMYGQIYMKPYRLPSRKRASPYSRWNDNVPSPRPELLTLPHFDIPRVTNKSEKLKKNEDVLSEPSGTSSSSDEEFGQSSDSKNSVSLRLYLPKPRAPIQRRFTLSGPPRPSAQSEQFWRELQLERSWRSSQNNSQMNNSNSEKLNKEEGNVDEMFQLRDKSASLGNSIATSPARPSTCINFSKAKMGSVKFDLPKMEPPSNNPGSNDKIIAEERDKARCDKEPSATSLFPAVEKNSDNGAEPVSAGAVNGSSKMTISELNKIKRDAFFNDMDCSGNGIPKCVSEDSSEKVKRIIENFKSEVSNIKIEISEPEIIHTPGKVSQLIGSFERKEIGRKSEKDKQDGLRRGKGNSEESRGGSDYMDMLRNKKKDCDLGIVQFSLTDTASITKSNLDIDKNADEPESHGQMVNTINDFLLPDRDYYGSGDFKTKDCQQFDEDDDSNVSDYDYRTCNEARGIVDTVNLALVELKQRQDHYDFRTKQKEEANTTRSEFGKEISSSSSASSLDRCSEMLKQEPDAKKPIPTQRKSKMPPEKLNDASLPAAPPPPKPRARAMEKVPELVHTPGGIKPPVKSRTPPELPPRPESTFSKARKPEPKENKEDVKMNEVTISTSVPAVNIPATSYSNKNHEIKQVPSPNLPVKEIKSGHSTRGPSTSVLNVVTEKPKSTGSPLESLKAMLSLGRKPLSFSSPRSVRKKNAMLARKRNKGHSYCSLVQILSSFFRGPTSFGFKSKDSQKADLFIHLPGFTCTLAEEVKSKEFAFKIYHTGTAFYFAANSREDLQQWLDCVSLATICPDEKQAPETVTFSVSDSDSSDTELEPETCFPTSPKMKKFLGSSPVPKPARSHQNLASDSKKTYDIQKRFGSLKKLSSQKHSSASHNVGSSEPGNAANSEIASLDRKYLRFLGHKNTPLPVPTSQFRSYRRMQPTAATAVHGKGIEKNENANKNQQNVNRDQPGLVRKTLHLSNPSLIHPDMADYRITQERLAEFRRLRNQENTQEGSGFMTLEQFMTSRQEEESSVRSNRSRPPELRGFMTLEQFLLMQEEERHLTNWSNRIREKPVSGYPRGDPSPSSSSHARTSSFDKVDNPKAKPRTTGLNSKHNAMKMKSSWKGEPTASGGPSNETEECSCAACESSLVYGMARTNNTTKPSSEEDEPNLSDCAQLNKDPTPDYPGIEYPPAFEPETYTIQYMLKNRRKRNTNKNKREDR
ncbi:UNVERIFIED_CONTAM: hypothetical protein PYX00_007933 [Menopon gallinae]|uniref:Connector enhancer of kinase suppressor of ras 2 n=1 Tax=Menopon gallinae TaxID=328185 RepID=A0AAW2HL74_9NEOP